jgi:hypothetical protein
LESPLNQMRAPATNPLLIAKVTNVIPTPVHNNAPVEGLVANLAALI